MPKSPPVPASQSVARPISLGQPRVAVIEISADGRIRPPDHEKIYSFAGGNAVVAIINGMTEPVEASIPAKSFKPHPPPEDPREGPTNPIDDSDEVKIKPGEVGTIEFRVKKREYFVKQSRKEGKEYLERATYKYTVYAKTKKRKLEPLDPDVEIAT